MRALEPDPADEYFDVVDAEGRPTGEIKRRSDVHRDGDWHRAFHCWVAVELEPDSPTVLFQRRSANKDTYPELLDVAVGGHYRAGEGFDEVVREIEEELGIDPPRKSLVRVGRRWAEGVTHSWIDREIEDVYVHCLTNSVESLRPACEEITAIDLIRLDEIEQLYGGRAREVASRRHLVRPDNTLEPASEARVTLADFIPVRDGYFLHGSRAAVRVLRGESGVRLELW